MTTGTQLQILPANMQLPAHLQTAEAVAAIAKYNAEAAGGIKIGGFPRISIKGSKFHLVEGGETTTIMSPAQPGQPPLPLMILEAVIASANPALSKTYYEGEYQAGDDHEPTCSSDNGVTPEAHITAPQSSACATCRQNEWGSKISKTTGKDVKACQDSKRLAILAARDLNYKALGLSIPPASLGDWGRYVKALSDRNIPINSIVTNITFDANVAFPKLLFSFSRMLTAEEYAKVQERAAGDDVKTITTVVRQVAVPRLPAPVQPAAPVVPPVAVSPAVPAAAAPVTGFGGPAVPPAAPIAPAGPAQAPAPEAPKRQRAPRKPAEQTPLALDALSHLPPEVRVVVNQLGADSELGKALIAKYPAPQAVAPQKEAAGSAGTPEHSPAQAAVPVGGFGAAATMQQPAPTTSAVANSLKEKLQARLQAAGQTPQAGS